MNNTKILLLGTLITISITSCSNYAVAPLGQEIIPPGEDKTINDISKLLTDHLREQYAGEGVTFLRDTHPKANACVQGTFVVEADISKEYQNGVFQPGAKHPVWMRFSNAVEEITNDYEKDFRGLAVKLTEVNGPRVEVPGDEKHTQDFLFLGHNAFFAANPEEFFDFFDAAFKGKVNSLWFFLTHPKGTYNILKGQARYTNPLNLKWNSVTSYALGKKENMSFKNVVRYALQTCSENGGEMPDESKPDYLTTNLQIQLHNGAACMDFYIQKQLDPEDMPVENALVVWDEELSPFIKIARITIPKQTFTSDAQKNYCENMSFNPGHSLLAHEPLGGINRARKVVMKAISDLRLKENKVKRFEPTGREVF